MKILNKVLPFISVVISVVCQLAIADSSLHPQADKPYYIYFLIIVASVYSVFFIVSFFHKGANEKLVYKGPFYAGTIQLINFINLITVKFALLPVLFFPSLDRVFGVFATDISLLIECIFYSLKLLIIGFAFGSIIGFFTGIFIGFSKKANYWITPLTKMIGPIPAMSWSPLVLSLFATSYQAAVFLIALAVWFPVVVMTNSGIQNIENSYFEVSSTLGAGKFYKIFKVGVPAAMPQIFLGMFNATCSSFVTLVTAEMFGCKSGIGWYINWQKSMMVYPNVYAGLILLAGLCSILIAVLFKVKDRILTWQKGVIKW